MNIFIVNQVSEIAGVQHFNAVPCADLESAKKVIEEEVETILFESPFYKKNNEDIKVSRKENEVYIYCPSNEYYSEYLNIEERELVEKNKH